MLTQKSVIERVRKFAREIKTANIGLREVILFGSYAKGNPTSESDIDVVLVADKFTGLGFDDVGLFSKIAVKKVYTDIQTLTYPPRYFKKGDPLVDEIKLTGIPISF